MLADNKSIIIFLYDKALQHLVLLSIYFFLEVHLLLCLEVLTVIHQAITVSFKSMVRVCCWIKNQRLSQGLVWAFTM